MVHSSIFDIDMADPLSTGGILLDLPFDPDFPALSDDDLGLLSAPTSPESLLDEPLNASMVAHAAEGIFATSFAPPSKSISASVTAATDSLHWDSILHDVSAEKAHRVVPKGAAVVHHHHHQYQHHPAATATGVMWNQVPTFDGPPPLRSVFSAPSPVSSDSDLDFRSFIAEECMSSDEEIHLSDGESGVVPGVVSRRSGPNAQPPVAGRKRRSSQQQQAADATISADAKAAQIQAKKAKLQALRQLPSHIAADTPEGKRHTHNVLERKRREDLKISYQNLRVEIPELAAVERAPTGQILVKAAEYIAELKSDEERIMSQLRALRMQNANLRRMCGADTSA